jgi:hypothetical protein
MMWSGQLIPRAGSCFFWIYSSCHLLCYWLIIIIDKMLFLTARSIGGLFSQVKGYSPVKSRVIACKLLYLFSLWACWFQQAIRNK